MRALGEDCLSWLPRRALPVLDTVSRSWLVRSRSVYVREIGTIANALGMAGVWFLNSSYQWGCTAVAREQEGAPWLARTLDWPLRGLGRHVEIAHMRGAVGEFYNVTWPGYVGVLTACAPGRFAAAINQAPLRRRTLKPWLRPLDLALNAAGTWGTRHVPPDHLLREVFETCRSFREARKQLETTPVARPVIFTLVGCNRGERCVIERTEEGCTAREDDTATANDWLHGQSRWEARINPGMVLTASYQDAAARSRARREALAGCCEPFGCAAFAWLVPPVLNAFTRVAVEMCPAQPLLRTAGYELATGDELARPVTQMCTLAGTTVEANLAS